MVSQILYMMNDKHPCQIHFTHTFTRISDKFTDMKKIHFKRGEMLATLFCHTHKKKSHLSVMEEPIGRGGTDDSTSEQLVRQMAEESCRWLVGNHL